MSITQREAPRDRGASPPGTRRWVGLGMLLTGTFIGILDIFVVNVAGPSIRAGLAASFGELQWVVAGYALAYAVGLVTGGRLGDAFGRRLVFVSGTVLFAVTSALCAAATTPGRLITFRVLQGLSAAVMLPQVLALIQVTFHGRERDRVMGYYGGVISLAALAGQFVGGVLLRLDVAGLGWRSVFLVNVPLCVVTLTGVWLTVEESRSSVRLRLDLPGIALLSLALLALLYPLVVGAEEGWSAPVTGMLAASPPLFGLFAWWERHLTRRGGAALLPPRLFARPTFTRGLLTALSFYGANSGFALILAFYLQEGRGLSPFASGLAFLPMTAMSATASLSASRLVARLGHRVTASGAAIAVAGLLACLAAASWAPPGAQAWALQPGLLLYGLGGGLIPPALVGLTLAGVAPDDAGAASGGLLTATQASEAIGVAAVGAVFAALVATSGHAGGFGLALLVLCGVLTFTFVCLRLLRPSDPV